MFHRPTSHAEALGPGVAGPALALAADAPGSVVRPSVQTPTSGAAPFAVAPGHVAGDGDNRQRTQ
mgnify:CR=1 FL=1|jgi:20S proteasome subunit beta 7